MRMAFLFPDPIGKGRDGMIWGVVLPWPSHADDCLPIKRSLHAANGMREIVAFAELAAPSTGDKLARGMGGLTVFAKDRDFFNGWFQDVVCTERVAKALKRLDKS